MAAFARDRRDVDCVGALRCRQFVALVVKLLRPDRPLLISGRAIIFLLVTLTLSAGILTNLTFKSYWGRPRPVVVTQFQRRSAIRAVVGSSRGLRPAIVRSSPVKAPLRFWTYAPAALTPPAWRPLAYVAATLFGVTTSALRMAFGGHFFTERPPPAGLVTFSGDLAGARLYLSLAVDPALRRAHRRRADTALAGRDIALLQRWRGARCGAPFPSV